MTKNKPLTTDEELQVVEKLIVEVVNRLDNLIDRAPPIRILYSIERTEECLAIIRKRLSKKP